MATAPKPTSPLTIAAAWIIVLIPLGWGVYQSVVKSLPLFQVSAPSEPRPSASGK
jgi:hypothetical protein